ncbi:MAG: TIGR00730 family Rossman fold protein [Phycisphaerales bacterium]|nr:TIGR00730 family Rossman fold protein [Phycisphaerales bacterium]
MQRITVYCASSTRLPDTTHEAAARIGSAIGAAGLELVYGGGSIGLMGTVSAAAKAAGARVHGVITSKLLAMEQGWEGCDELEVVETMQQRRRRLLDLADGLLVLPGGLGTMEEFFEAIVGRQLGDHGTPIVLVDIDDGLASLSAMLDDLIARNLVRESVRTLYRVTNHPDAALDVLRSMPCGVVDPNAHVPSGS